jgi:hypothetical protein
VLDLPAQRAPGVGDADVDHVGGRVAARHQRLHGSAPNLVVDPAMAWIDEQLVLDGADAAHGPRDVDRTETSIALEPVTRDLAPVARGADARAGGGERAAYPSPSRASAALHHGCLPLITSPSGEGAALQRRGA